MSANKSQWVDFFLNQDFNTTGNISLRDVSLEQHPFLEYEGWKKAAFLTYIAVTTGIEMFMKVVLVKFAKTTKISDRPINVIFITDQGFQGLGYLTMGLMTIASSASNVPIAELFDSMTAGWVFVTIGLFTLMSKSTLSLTMAIYRLMCIKAANIVKYSIGEIRFAMILMIFGYLFCGVLVYCWANIDPSQLVAVNMALGRSSYQSQIHQKHAGETPDKDQVM